LREADFPNLNFSMTMTLKRATLGGNVGLFCKHMLDTNKIIEIFVHFLGEVVGK